MKRNRLFIWLMAGLSLLAVACTEQEQANQQTGDPTALHATIIEDVAATRSIVVDNPGIKLESFWKDGDQIGVFGESDKNITFSVTQSAISSDGKSADFNSPAGIPAGQLMAYYPYSANATQSGDGLALDFPATQHYTTVGGIAQPDPEACAMAGIGTRGNGISFVNLMAVLKVGQVFSSETQVRSVEFRDLDDGPVCGSYTVSFDGSVPTTTFAGGGKVLTLDLGNEGVTAYKGGLFTVFIVVPARSYPKGFEITFIDIDGNRTVKTAGSRDGKKLQRSVVYPVGDITTYESVPGMSYELKPNAQIMTPDKLDMVNVVGTQREYVKTDDGETALDRDGVPIVMPTLNMIVHKDMNPQEGGYLIFNQPSSDLPHGGVYKIEQCKESYDGEHYEVWAVPEANFAAAFEKLVIGEPLYDSEGNLNPDGGIDLDIASYVKEIRDADGNVISSYEVPTYDMNFVETMARNTATRGSVSHTYTPPALTLSMDDGSHCTCDVSAQMSLGVRIAIGAFAGELQYIYTTVNPKLDLKTTFGLYGKVEKSKREHLITLYTAGIPIGPVIIIPEITFEGIGGIGGEVKFTASTKFSYDLGTYGLSYNKGEGLNFRKKYNQPAKNDGFMPQLDASLQGSLYAYGGIGIKIGLSVYAMCSLGLSTDVQLKFGIVSDSSNRSAVKLALTPEVVVTPYTAVLGGRLAKLWNGLSGKIELESIWERYLIPGVYGTTGLELQYTEPRTITMDYGGYEGTMSGVSIPYGAKIAYDLLLKGRPLRDWDVVINVYDGANYQFLDDLFGNHSDIDLEFIQTWERNGIRHIFQPSVFIPKPRRVAQVSLGKYTTDLDSLELKGTADYESHTLNFEFQSGVPYATREGIERGSVKIPEEDYYEEILIGNKTYSGLIGKIFFWPNRANGEPY